MILVGVFAAPPSQGVAKPTTAKTIVLHPRFHVAGVQAAVESDGRYTLVVARSMPSGPFGTLIDEQTGRSTTIPYASYPSGADACSNGGLGGYSFGGPWLLVSACATPLEPVAVDLYSLADGTGSEIQLRVPFCSDYGAECTFGPIGADWLEVDETCYHCTAQSQLVNLQTGELRSLPGTNSKTVLDLNTTSPTSRVCADLSVPSGGTLTLYGKLAVMDSPRGGYVGRCGSRRRVPLPPDPIMSNSHEVLWYSTLPDQLDGITLPAMKQFVVALPRAFPAGMTGFVLSSRTLYAELNNGVFLTAPAPEPPLALVGL